LVANQKQPGSFADSLVRLFINGQQQQLETIQGNLFMHPKERVQDYNRRVRMSYYYNFCAPIIDIYTDHLLKQAVIEDWKELQSTIKEVDKDIDLLGSSIQEFRKQVAEMAQNYGHCFVVVDSPSQTQTGEVISKADQIQKRAFPYLTVYSPQSLMNWSLDKNGFPYWVLLREVYDGNEDPAQFKKDGDRTCGYRLLTRETWHRYDADFQLVEEGAHPVGEVPITCVYDKRSKKERAFLGISSIADIAFIARDIYNASSELRQILRDQTFAFLAIQGNSDDYSGVDLGTGKGLFYPEGMNKPEYVSPPSDNAQTYFMHIDRQISKIYQLAKLESGGLSGTQSNPDSIADNQSGVSKAWSFNQTNSSLSTKSSNLEDAEMRWWRLFAKWLGIDKWTGNIQYPNEFSVTALSEDLDEAEKESRLQMGMTFNVEIRKAIIKKKFPRKSDEEIEKMAKEVEELQKRIERDQQATPLTTRIKALLGKDQTNTGTAGINNQGGSNG